MVVCRIRLPARLRNRNILIPRELQGQLSNDGGYKIGSYRGFRQTAVTYRSHLGKNSKKSPIPVGDVFEILSLAAVLEIKSGGCLTESPVVFFEHKKYFFVAENLSRCYKSPKTALVASNVFLYRIHTVATLIGAS